MASLPPHRGPRAWTRGPGAALSVVALLLALAIFSAPGGLGSGSSAAAAGSHTRSASEQPAGEYFVTFTETGLPSGTFWSVTLNGTPGTNSSTGNSIGFTVFNATYQFSVGGGAGYTPSPATGSVLVNGGPAFQGISWSLPTYQLSFTQSGLPTGTTWFAKVNGVEYSTTGVSLLTATLAAGTFYSYNLWSFNPTYAPVPGTASGSGNLDGPTNIPVSFVPVTYTVTFTETGLPTGTEWSVNVAGAPTQPPPTTGTSIAVSGLINGSYTYSVRSYNVSWSNPGGGFTVSGGSIGINVPFKEEAFTVTFFETGLPGSLLSLWSVSFNGGSPVSTGTRYIYFDNVPNGSYRFTVGTITGWIATPLSGTVNVTGADPPTQVITWSQAVYNVTFNESGLGSTPPRWWVNFTGTYVASHVGIGSPIVVTLPNGTYDYTIACQDKRWAPNVYGGSFVVNGMPLEFSITFVERNQTVTFAESGLPTGMQWWANVSGGLTSNSTGTTILYELPNGTYTYRVQAVNRSYAASGGAFNVTGSAVQVNIAFTNITFAVTFNESGLAAGTDWSVNLSGTVTHSTGISISFLENSGTYAYQVGPVPGYTIKAATGDVVVRTKPVNVAIVFHAVTVSISFDESGLPAATLWWVNIAWTNLTNVGSFNSTSVTIPVTLANGNYTYSVATADKSYVPTPSSGDFMVNGNASAGMIITITFQPSAYPVTFVALDLPSGSNWSMVLTTTHTVNGTSNGTTSITFYLRNQSYPFTVYPYGIYYPSTNASGNVVVQGAGVTLYVTFIKALFSVTFVETGLSSGATWAVTFDGVTEQSTGSTLAFPAPNGTFPFSIPSTGGYAPSPSSGFVHVVGSGITMSIAFGLPSGGIINGLSWPQIALLGAVIGAGALVLIALLASRRSRRQSPASSSMSSWTPPSPPLGAVSPTLIPSPAPTSATPAGGAANPSGSAKVSRPPGGSP